MSAPPRPRLHLRELPLSARLVLTLFLVFVGLGYFSALVQLHIAHSDMKGDPLPPPNDVVKRFSHFQMYDGKEPKSHVEELISGDREIGWGPSNMTPAFFDKSDKYDKIKDLKKNDPKRVKVDNAREGERLALIAFINIKDAEARKAAYKDDAMVLPDSLKGQPITEVYLTEEEGKPKKVMVQTLITDRCGKCHDAGQIPNFPDFERLEPLITPPTLDIRHSVGGPYIPSGSTMSVADLTRSTHAHALSFAVLFCLTGLIYAHTSQPAFLRGMLAPIVLLAQMMDLSFWWLARMDLPWGPLFALGIMGTGGVVGLGLILQIVLSLFDMYRWRGRAVLAASAAVVLVILGVTYGTWIHPALKAEKERATAAQQQHGPEKPAGDNTKKP